MTYEIKIKEFENMREVFETQELPNTPHEINHIKFLFETDVEMNQDAQIRASDVFIDELISYGFINEGLVFTYTFEVFESSNYSITAYITTE